MEILQGFAGGVLLANALLHMLPESHEFIQEGIKASLPAEPGNGTSAETHNASSIIVASTFRRFTRSGAHGEESGPWFQTFPWAGLICGSVIFVMVRCPNYSFFTPA